MKPISQTEPIGIAVDYHSKSEIQEHIKELLWNYRRIFLPGAVELKNKKVKTESEIKDYIQYERESEQAWSALEAAFKHRREFSRTFLSDMSDGALERTTNTLVQWTESIQWPGASTVGRWTTSAQDADECYQKTSDFMRDRLWPFTKIIR